MADKTDTSTNVEKIDSLKTEFDDIKKSLTELTNQLKNNDSLSEDEKKAKTDELKAKADELEQTKQKIENEIHSLESKTDDDSKKAKEKAEILLTTINETMALYDSILNTESTNVSSTTPETKDGEKKSFKDWIWDKWDKTKDWAWEQWDKVKENPGKYILRATGLAAAWVAIKKAWNRLSWKRKKKKKEWKSETSSENNKSKEEQKKWFWERPLWKTITGIWMGLWILSWAYYVTHWAVTWNWAPRDMFDRSREKKLKFDDAMNYCKWAIANERGLDWAQYDMDLKYHEETSEIEAYWERIKINKNSRKIEWLAVTFKSYEHMINTAIIIAFLKKNYSWLCSKKDPFSLSWSRTWNVEVNTNGKDEKALDWTWKWWRITGIWGAAILSIITGIRSKSVRVWASTLIAWWALWFIWWYAFDTDNPMSKHMPELDNEYWKKALAWYLNNLDCWEARKQSVEDITASPIKPEVEECMKDIEDTNKELVSRWSRRKLDAIQDPNNPSRYTIKAYSRDFSAEVSWEWEDKKIKILWISWWNPSIKVNPNKPEKAESFFKLEMPLKEGLYLSNFLWYILDDNSNCILKWNKYPYFYYWKRAWLAKPWIYFNDPSWDTYILTEESFKKRMPTVFNNKNLLLDFLNDWIVFNNWYDVRRNPDTLKDA